MAAKKRPILNEIVHLHVWPGETAVYEGKAYGDRATLQVPRGDLDRVQGKVTEVDPNKVPDVGDLPAA
jgi:hypothetical protein